jgi:Collagen triple helix repeat (20 copies)
MKHRLGMAVAVPVLLAGLAFGAAASGAPHAAKRPGIPNAKGVYAACYATKGGAVRLVRTRRCKLGERRVTWNQLGRTGPRGLVGPTGATGALGPQGPQGPQGLQGDAGATGPAGPAGRDGATGPAGPEGPAGADGAIGPAGPAASQVSFGSAVASGGSDAAGTPFGPSTASCPAGEVALGGGAIVANGNNAKAAVYLSAPTPRTDGVTPTGWEAQGIITIRTANGQSPTIQAFVVCSN